MKKNLLLLAVALGFASVSFGQTSYGIKAGLNFPKLALSDGSATITTKPSTNFYLTGYADINIAQNLSIQPGLSLQGKGGKANVFTEYTVDTDGTISLLYLEIPVNFVYYIPAGPGNVLLGAGPYVGYGLSSQIKGAGEKESSSFSKAGFKAFDGGLNFLAGYKLSNGFLINGGYGLGLGNFLKDADGESIKNRVFSVGVGYQF